MIRDTRQPGAIGSDRVNLVVAVAIAGEHDAAAVGRPTRADVLFGAVSQSANVGAVVDREVGMKQLDDVLPVIGSVANVAEQDILITA